MVGGADLGLDLAEELGRLAPVRDGQPGGAAAGPRRPGSATCGRWGRRASTPASASTAAPTGRSASPSAARSSASATTTRSTPRCGSRSTTGTARSSRGSSCASSTRTRSRRRRRTSADEAERVVGALRGRARRRPPAADGRAASDGDRGRRRGADGLPGRPARPPRRSPSSPRAAPSVLGLVADLPRRAPLAQDRRPARRVRRAGARPGPGRAASSTSSSSTRRPSPHLERLACAPPADGGGYLHPAWGEPERRFALAALGDAARPARRCSPASSATCATPATSGGAGAATRRFAAAAPHPRGPGGGGALLRASSPSSGSCRGRPTVAAATSGSYPQRGPIWSARRRFAPTAPAIRRVADTSKDANRR